MYEIMKILDTAIKNIKASDLLKENPDNYQQILINKMRYYNFRNFPEEELYKAIQIRLNYLEGMSLSDAILCWVLRYITKEDYDNISYDKIKYALDVCYKYIDSNNNSIKSYAKGGIKNVVSTIQVEKFTNDIIKNFLYEKLSSVWDGSFDLHQYIQETLMPWFFYERYIETERKGDSYILHFNLHEQMPEDVLKGRIIGTEKYFTDRNFDFEAVLRQKIDLTKEIENGTMTIKGWMVFFNADIILHI